MVADSIVGVFLDTCNRVPDKVCVSFENENLTYAGLRESAARWAGALRAWGGRPGDRIALYIDNSTTFLAAYLGVQLAGAIVVLVNTQYRQVELRHILDDAGVRLCVADAERRSELARVVGDLPHLEAIVLVGGESVTTDQATTTTVPVVVSSDRFLQRSVPMRPSPPPPGETALIGYTSGTTGRSKGAMLSHANLIANALAVRAAWRWTANDRLLLTLPLFHVHGLCVGMHGTWLAGASVDLRRRFDVSDVFDTLLSGGVSLFFGVPTMYTRLVAEAQRRGIRPPRIRLYVSGSAPLNVQTFADFERLFGQRILERYGMTETLMNLTNPYDGERRSGTVGQPFPGQEARIVDVKTGEPISNERPGEIQVRGPHVFQGYWGRPDDTAAALDQNGWFSTGDLGWRSKDGYFTISGRARELIITGGFNVYPREIEEVLLTHPCVAEAAVVGLPDAEFGEQVVAVVVTRGAADATSPDALIALCREQLASYKKPRHVIFADSLPRNALGKVQKHILREQLLEQSSTIDG